MDYWLKQPGSIQPENAANKRPSERMKKRGREGPRFHPEEFHDSTIVSVDFSNWLETIVITLYCPHARSNSKNPGRLKKLVFRCVLHFGFEAACLGEFFGQRPLIHAVAIKESSAELDAWRARLAELAKPSAPDYPQGIRSERFSDLHHFVFDGTDFRGTACMPGNRGFQVICRDFAVEDAEMPAGFPIPPASAIPGA